MKHKFILRLLPKYPIDFLFIAIIIFLSLPINLISINKIIFSDEIPDYFEALFSLLTFYIYLIIPENAGIGGGYYYIYSLALLICCVVLLSFIFRIFYKKINPLSVIATLFLVLITSGLLYFLGSSISSHRLNKEQKLLNEIGSQMQLSLKECQTITSEERHRTLSCRFTIHNAPTLTGNEQAELYFHSTEFPNDSAGLQAVVAQLENKNGAVIGNFEVSETEIYTLESMYISQFIFIDNFDQYNSGSIIIDLVN